MNTDLFLKEKKIISRFSADEVTDITPVGHGNINYTHIVTLKKQNGAAYRVILQKINSSIFPNVDGLMGNIYSITEYLRSHLAPGEDPDRAVMTVVKTLDGKLYAPYGKEYYRCYTMVENSVSYQKVENLQDFFNCGYVFGDFQHRLADFPAWVLCDVVNDYHNTLVRYENLVKAIKSNKSGRKVMVEKEIEFFLGRRHLAGLITEKINSKSIPLRVVHNDAKLNNILFDADTNQPICVVDFDTVSLGAACFDFGDAIRFAGTRQPSAETGQITLDLEMFTAYTQGYLSVAKQFLTAAEIDTLAVSALVITYECGMRFLTDFLDGDKHFRINYPLHNLDRCRNHIKLVEDIERKLPLMQDIVKKYAQ